MEYKSPQAVYGNNRLLFDAPGKYFQTVDVIPSWLKVIKRMLDVTMASLALVFLLPLMIFIAIRIKLDSKGSIFYVQERAGFKGVPFNIFKFRSMMQNSEENGPCLSSSNDTRITKWGRVMRRWKLDELPQLLNIVLGDMSLVGPRPERQYYIDKVSASYPYFTYLHRVKPGLTSMGMIKFGYAQNMEQIIERIAFDTSYIKNYSLLLDFQIMYHTLRVIGSGNGI